MNRKNESKIGMKYKKNRAEIVKESCANYDDKTSFCLLTDKACPLVPFSYRGHTFPTDEAVCDYFNTSVLVIRENKEPTEDASETTTDKTKVIYSYRDCVICGQDFKPNNSRSKYCSDNCKSLGRKRINNRYYTNKL